MINYVAFLRGINVGGKRLIKMEDLRRVVESIGLKNVRTFIASGNLLFETSQTNRDALARKIEEVVLWHPEPGGPLEGTPNKFVQGKK